MKKQEHSVVEGTIARIGLTMLSLIVSGFATFISSEVVANPDSGQVRPALQSNRQQQTSLPPPATKKIFRQTMADGSVSFTDVPERGAIKNVETRYQTTSTPEAMRIASANQEYWRKQEAAFERRQEKRELDNERLYRERLYSERVIRDRQRAQDSYWNGPRVVNGVTNFPPNSGPLPPQITSGLGAAHSQPSSFIGSGFATSSPFRR